MSLLAAHFDAAQQVMGPGAPDLSLRRHWQRLKCLCPAGKEEHHAKPLNTQHPLTEVLSAQNKPEMVVPWEGRTIMVIIP